MPQLLCGNPGSLISRTLCNFLHIYNGFHLFWWSRIYEMKNERKILGGNSRFRSSSRKQKGKANEDKIALRQRFTLVGLWRRPCFFSGNISCRCSVPGNISCQRVLERTSSSWRSSRGGVDLVGELLGEGAEVEGAIKGSVPWCSPSSKFPSLLAGLHDDGLINGASQRELEVDSCWGLEPATSERIRSCSVFVAALLKLQKKLP